MNTQDPVTTEAPSQQTQGQSASPKVVHDLKSRPMPSSQPWPLRYRKRTLWLLALYVPLLVLPWIFTCILAVRPLNHSSYIDQMGRYSATDLLRSISTFEAVRILNTIASILTIPLISAILAQAAVVYIQRRKENQEVTNIRQTFALADRGWIDLGVLWKAVYGHERGGGSKFLRYAAGLMLLCIIQQPLQTGLVTFNAFEVPFCKNNLNSGYDPACAEGDYGPYGNIAAFDPEPGDLATIPANVVLDKVISGIASMSDKDYQPRLWTETNDSWSGRSSFQPLRQTLYWETREDSKDRFFVSNLLNGTTTGVLRQHAMRLNSTAKCSAIPQEAFPTVCPGQRPFSADYSKPGLSINVCVPGNYTENPYLPHRNRQDIKEELFLDVLAHRITYDDLSMDNFTLHCEVNTSRGYFELGNYQNGYKAGPLLDKWPSLDDSMNTFNDYNGMTTGVAGPREWDIRNTTYTRAVSWPPTVSQGDDYTYLTPGPLTISAMAMFGERSVFHVAANSTDTTYPSPSYQICQQGSFGPRLRNLLSLDYLGRCYGAKMDNNESSQYNLREMLKLWISSFQKPKTMEMMLNAVTFYANEVVLTETATATMMLGSAREIWTSPPMTMFKPQKSLAATVIISLLLVAQLLALGFLVWYIYRVPTWTHALDSASIATLVSGIEEIKNLPPLGLLEEKDLKKMENISSLVGVETFEEEMNAEETVKTGTGSRPELAVGAFGLITRDLVRPRKWRK